MKKWIVLMVTVCLAFGVYFYHSVRKTSSQLDNEPIVKKEALKIRVRSSVKTVSIGKIYAKIYIPAVNKRVPLVIVSNGYTATYRDYEGIAKRLYKRGVACVVFDFRGGAKQSKSGGDMSKMTAGSLEADLNSVIDYMKRQDYVNDRKIYLAGHSQGGLISSLVADRRTDIAGLFLAAPAYNIPLLLRYDPSEKTLKIGNGEMSSRYIRSMKKVHLYQDISHFRGPVYIFQGTEDTTVPPQYAKEAVRHYKKGHLILMNGETHAFDEEGMDTICQKAISVIKKGTRERSFPYFR